MMNLFKRAAASVVSLAMLLTSAGVVNVAEAASENLSYTENFSQYNSENAVIGTKGDSSTHIWAVRGDTSPKQVAENDTGIWELSGIWSCSSGTNEPTGHAWASTSHLGVYSQRSQRTLMNFRMKNYDLERLNSFSAKLQGEGATMAVRFMISEDEKSWYEIGRGEQPYLKKSVNGTETMLVEAPYTPAVKDDEGNVVTEQVGDDWPICNYPGPVKITGIDYETNTISYQVKIDDEGSNIHLNWEGSYVDEDLSKIAEASVYPVGFMARGWNDGGVYLSSLTFDADVKLKDSLRFDYYEQFTDLEADANNEVIFSGSKIESGSVVTDNGYTLNGVTRLTGEAVSTKSAAQKLFSANGADYILSKVWTAAYSFVNNGTNHPGGGGYYTTGDSLYVRDKYAWKTTVNTDLGDNIYENISEITAKGKTMLNDMGGELRFMVSADEKSYYYIGTGRNSYSIRFGKVVNGTEVNINTADDTDEGVGSKCFDSGRMSGDIGIDLKRYDITVNGNTITWKAARGTDVWTGSYTDESLPVMLANTRYPTAFSSIGDGYALWDDVGISYEAVPTPDFEDNFAYTAANSVLGSENALFGTPGIPQTIASGNGYAWELSGVYTGNSNNGVRGNSYITTDGKACVKDMHQGATALNLNMGDMTYNNISRIGVSAKGIGSRTGMRFMVSGDEKSYYEVGVGGNNNTAGTDSLGTAGAVNRYAPYFAKVENGTITIIDNVLFPDWIGTNTSLASNPHNWTVTIDGNKIKVKVMLGTKYWETEYTDANLPKMLQKTVYPVSFIAIGDNDATFDDLTMNYSATENVAPIFEETFSDFAAADCPAYGAANYIQADANLPKLIAKNANAMWSTSGIQLGSTSAKKYGGAALDNTNGKLIVGDLYQSGTAVYMTPASRLYDINKIKFNSVSAEDVRTGARLFTSGDERSYYEIAYGRGSSNSGSILKNTPYIIKVVDGKQVHFETAEAWTVGAGTEKDWTITIDGDKITVYVEAGSASWSATYQDADLQDMMKNAAYTFGAFVWGDGKGKLDNLRIYGKVAGDLKADNGDGTFTVNVLPELYDVTNSTIDAVTVCYDAQGNTESIDVKTVTDLSKESSFTYNIPSSGKYDVFLFDGAYTDGKALQKKDYKGYMINESIPAERIKVACIGDSLTEGHGSTNNQTRSYPGVLQRLLGAEYEVVNYGLGSRTLMNSGAMPYMSEQYFIDSQDFQPDIVTIMLGTNDRGANFSDQAVCQEFYDDYKTMITTYQGLASSPEVILFVPPGEGSGPSATSNFQLYIRPIIKQLGKDLGCRVVDMQTLITDYSVISSDKLHWTNKGYMDFADQFYDAITDNIAKFDVTDSEITINPTAEIYGDVYAATYKGEELISVKQFKNKELTSAVDTVLDISEVVKTGADRIKLMAWSGTDTINAITDVLVSPVNTVVASGNKATVYITGGEGEINSVEVTDGAGNLIYINQIASDNNGLVSAVIPEYASGYTIKINGIAQ